MSTQSEFQSSSLRNQAEIPDIIVRKFGTTRAQITMREPNFGFIFSLKDARNVGNKDWTIPLESLPSLYTTLTKQYLHFSFHFDQATASYISESIEKENRVLAAVTAEDADNIPDVFGPITLRPHQKVAIQRLEVSNDNTLLAYDMGLGKTAIAIIYAERNSYRTLFLTKASLVSNLDREIRKIADKKPIILSGRNPDRTAMMALFNPANQYFILNYEVVGTEVTDDDDNVVARPWVDLINTMSTMGKVDFVVADEAHSCKNLLAKRTRALIHITEPPHRLPMTGTPLTNKTKDLFPLIHWVDPKAFPSEGSFLNTYDDGFGNPRDPKALQKALMPYLLRRAKKDVIKDLPPIVRMDYDVELSALFKDRYEQALEMVYIAASGAEWEINSILAQLTRLRQIVADAKIQSSIEYVEDFLETTDSKILVFSNFVNPTLSIARHFGANAIVGGENRRMEFVDDFERNPETRILCLSYATGQEGLNLTAADTVLHNDLSWVPKDHLQAEGRCYGRMNDLHGATSVYMRIKGTIDEQLAELQKTKIRRSEEAIEGTKEYIDSQHSIMSEFLSILRGMR